jgi:hypothetical protein
VGFSRRLAFSTRLSGDGPPALLDLVGLKSHGGHDHLFVELALALLRLICFPPPILNLFLESENEPKFGCRVEAPRKCDYATGGLEQSEAGTSAQAIKCVGLKQYSLIHSTLIISTFSFCCFGSNPCNYQPF